MDTSDNVAQLRKPRDYIVTGSVVLSSVPDGQIRSDCATRETCLSDAFMFLVDGKIFYSSVLSSTETFSGDLKQFVILPYTAR